MTPRTSRVYVSGTASINEAGDTIHKNNIEKQTEHTLAVIKDLLGVKGHDFLPHHPHGDVPEKGEVRRPSSRRWPDARAST